MPAAKATGCIPGRPHGGLCCLRLIRQRRGVVDFHCAIRAIDGQVLAVWAKGDAVASAIEGEQLFSGLTIPYLHRAKVPPTLTARSQAFAVWAEGHASDVVGVPFE